MRWWRRKKWGVEDLSTLLYHGEPYVWPCKNKKDAEKTAELMNKQRGMKRARVVEVTG